MFSQRMMKDFVYDAAATGAVYVFASRTAPGLFVPPTGGAMLSVDTFRAGAAIMACSMMGQAIVDEAVGRGYL